MSYTEEELTCKRCHELCSLDEGTEPTDYCHPCTQELVPELEEKVRELARIVRGVLDERDKLKAAVADAKAVIQLLARDGVRASAEEWERVKPWLSDDVRQKPAAAAELAAKHGFREHGDELRAAIASPQPTAAVDEKMSVSTFFELRTVLGADPIDSLEDAAIRMALDLQRLKLWQATVRDAVRSGASGHGALDQANEAAFRGQPQLMQPAATEPELCIGCGHPSGTFDACLVCSQVRTERGDCEECLGTGRREIGTGHCADPTCGICGGSLEGDCDDCGGTGKKPPAGQAAVIFCDFEGCDVTVEREGDLCQAHVEWRLASRILRSRAKASPGSEKLPSEERAGEGSATIGARCIASLGVSVVRDEAEERAGACTCMRGAGDYLRDEDCPTHGGRVVDDGFGEDGKPKFKLVRERCWHGWHTWQGPEADLPACPRCGGNRGSAGRWSDEEK